MAKKLDDLLKEFEKKADKATSSKRPLWEGSEEDNIYCVDIHIWREPGMGNSLQTIAGNKISIMTATSSFIQTLLTNKVISERDLDYMIDAIKEVYHGNAK